MCGRFVTIIPYEELKRIFSLVEGEISTIEPRYNVAPSQQVAVVRSAGDHNILVSMSWGLVPSWSKDTTIASHTINARSETVAEKPAYRHAIKYNRCIIPVSGFYEWKQVEHHKEPYFIRLTNHKPMCFAGIWESWKDSENSALETFSILTTSSNDLIAPIHDRMPVILTPEDLSLWLSKNVHDPHELERLYTPFPSDMMTAYNVPDLVNNPRFDSPACISRV